MFKPLPERIQLFDLFPHLIKPSTIQKKDLTRILYKVIFNMYNKRMENINSSEQSKNSQIESSDIQLFPFEKKKNYRDNIRD